jgi:hypothetical protein
MPQRAAARGARVEIAARSAVARAEVDVQLLAGMDVGLGA